MEVLEDELKTTVMASAAYQHKFKKAVCSVWDLTIPFTGKRKYYFDNIMPTFTGHDAFKLLSDEQVFDLNLITLNL